jgi:hypothetical protein
MPQIAAQRNPPEHERVEDYYRRALTLADELGMRPLGTHCRRGLGTLYATTGQREQARAALDTAISLYRAMDMTFWLPQTEVALAQLKERSPFPFPPPSLGRMQGGEPRPLGPHPNLPPPRGRGQPLAQRVLTA